MKNMMPSGGLGRKNQSTENRFEHAQRYQQSRQQAWIVFGAQADLPFLRLLKAGFRHCYVLIHDGRYWMTVDPMLHYMDVRVHYDIDPAFDFPAYLRAGGYDVVPASIARHGRKAAILRPFSCVEVVKRYLGIRNPFILTPWQLRCYVQKQMRHAADGSFSQPLPTSQEISHG